jgi:hypothetical protein
VVCTSWWEEREVVMPGKGDNLGIELRIEPVSLRDSGLELVNQRRSGNTAESRRSGDMKGILQSLR